MTDSPKNSGDHLIHLTEEVEKIESNPDLFHGVLTLYSREILPVLRKCGFRRITPLAREKAPKGPHYTALRDGRPCCLCFHPIVSDTISLDALTSEQCEACDDLFPEHDVYYSALLEGSDGLYLFSPTLVKNADGWMTNDTHVEQFLPLGMSKFRTRFRFLLGGCEDFKLFHMVIPYAATNGEPLSIRIDGIGSKVREEPYLLFSCRELPHLLILSKIVDKEKKRCECAGMFFYYEHDERLELELIRRVGDNPESGVIQLMEEHGATFYAECVEAAALPSALRMPLRYTWSLSMVAEYISPLEREFSVSSGPLVEDAKNEYREKHGEEPPQDFSINVSMDHMRHFSQDDESTMADGVGKITALEEKTLFYRPFTVATLNFLPNDDTSVIKVIISHSLLKDYKPSVGDLVSFSGILQAIPDGVVEDGESWHTDPSLKEKKEGHDRTIQAMVSYEQFAKYSIGMAVVISAFVAEGWVHVPGSFDENFSRTRSAVIMQRGEDELMFILVDTVIDGHEPDFSYEGQTDFFHKFAKKYFSENARICRAIVSLNSYAESDHYKISMRLEPDIPGVKNRLVSAGCPFSESTLSINEDGTSEMKRERPEVLDEAYAASLLLNAFTKREWLNLAQWMREELDYISDSVKHRHYVGKIDYLRYICERAINWADRGVMPSLSISTGTVCVDGVDRPATALHHDGAVTTVTIFSDSHGLIGAMRSLPAQFFSAYSRTSDLIPMVSPEAGIPEDED